jgi:hypothetical protein
LQHAQPRRRMIGVGAREHAPRSGRSRSREEQ